MTIRNAQKGVMMTDGSYNTISDVRITDVGQEAIHLRSNTTDSTVIGNLIQNTGRQTAQYGEAVYVGTDPDAWCTYSACNPDRSDRNSILDNTMTGITADGIDAKAGTTDGYARGNTIDGSAMTATNSGGWIVIKGNGWVVEANNGTNAPANGLVGHVLQSLWLGPGQRVLQEPDRGGQLHRLRGVAAEGHRQPGGLRQHSHRQQSDRQRRLPALSHGACPGHPGSGRPPSHHGDPRAAVNRDRSMTSRSRMRT